MGLKDGLRRWLGAARLACLRDEYDRLTRRGASHKTAGLQLISRHLRIPDEGDPLDEGEGEEDPLPLMLDFAVDSLSDRDWLCSFLDLSVRYRLSTELRTCLGMDEQIFELTGSLFMVGMPFFAISNNTFKACMLERKVAEYDLKDMLEAAFLASLLAPVSPAGWAALAACEKIGLRFAGDERVVPDYVRAGLEACDSSEKALRALGLSETADGTQAMREHLMQLATT